MWQNSSGCCCLWSGKAWVNHATGLYFSQSWPVLIKYFEAKNTPEVPALRRKTISSRLIDLSLYPHRDYFLSCDGFFYIESAPGCIFSTQTRSADISSKINCWEWLVESETKTSAVTWQHANYHSRNSVEVQCFPGFTRIKLSNHANAADWYMWNITDKLPDESCVDMTYPDNMLAGLEDLTVTKQCAVKQ